MYVLLIKCQEIVPSALHMYCHLILKTFLSQKFYYYNHFTDDKTKAQRS